jgi:hypothetical protein
MWDVPLTASATTILPSDSEKGIPSLEDLLLITQQWEEEFAKGARAIKVIFGTGDTQVLHFSKVPISSGLMYLYPAENDP